MKRAESPIHVQGTACRSEQETIMRYSLIALNSEAFPVRTSYKASVHREPMSFICKTIVSCQLWPLWYCSLFSNHRSTSNPSIVLTRTPQPVRNWVSMVKLKYHGCGSLITNLYLRGTPSKVTSSNSSGQKWQAAIPVVAIACSRSDHWPSLHVRSNPPLYGKVLHRIILLYHSWWPLGHVDQHFIIVSRSLKSATSDYVLAVDTSNKTSARAALKGK